MSSFFPGVTARQLIPGDPGGLQTLVQRLSILGDGLGDAASQLQRIEAGSWKGAAADAFRTAVRQTPGEYSRSASSFQAAAAAIGAYAEALTVAQSTASTAIAEWEQAQSATASWVNAKSAHATASPSLQLSVGPDPGAAGRSRAESTLGNARAELDSAAARVRAALASAGTDAPKSPRGLRSLITGLARIGSVERVAGGILLHWGTEFTKGVWEGSKGLAISVVQLGEFSWSISPMRAEIDPLGWAKTVKSDARATAAVATSVKRNPVLFAKNFGKTVTDWDEFSKDPAKAMGNLAPSLVLAIVTAGTGSASEGMTDMALDAERAGDLPTATKLAEQAQTLRQTQEGLNAVDNAQKAQGVVQAANEATGKDKSEPDAGKGMAEEELINEVLGL